MYLVNYLYLRKSKLFYISFITQLILISRSILLCKRKKLWLLCYNVYNGGIVMVVSRFDNYKILFLLRILKSILNNFVDVFFVLYFLTVSNGNILPLGIYKLVFVFFVWVVFWYYKSVIINYKNVIEYYTSFYYD